MGNVIIIQYYKRQKELLVGLLICLTVIAFNFVGDGLRDAYDPKSKR